MTRRTDLRLIDKPSKCLKCEKLVICEKDIACTVFHPDGRFKGYICISHATQYPKWRKGIKNHPYALTGRWGKSGRKHKMPKSIRKEIEEEMKKEELDDF